MIAITCTLWMPFENRDGLGGVLARIDESSQW
jgi:hypothetical protein